MAETLDKSLHQIAEKLPSPEFDSVAYEIATTGDLVRAHSLAYVRRIAALDTLLDLERRALLLQSRRWEEARELLVRTLPILAQYLDADPIADTMGVVSDLYRDISEEALGMQPEDAGP
ncbi:hypothetical protein LCGC14_1109750 [marine sediment metagenome]|uniref:Uncharacterized protein n=1 Tax=marine sediment metagenome TaxID=412755 RepID=A0A0F9PQ42_9ZZZZ